MITSADRSDWRAWCNRADVAARLGRWDDAAVALEQAAALNPGEAAIHRNLGAVLTSIGRFEEGLAQFKKATELDPGNVQGRLDYAGFLIDAGRKKEAATEIQEASRVALKLVLPSSKQSTSDKISDISADRIADVRKLGRLLDRLNQVDDLRELVSAAKKAGIGLGALGSLWASLAFREGRVEQAKHLLLQDGRLFGDAHWHRLMTKVADALGDADAAFTAAGEMNYAVPDHKGWRRRAEAYRANIRLTAAVVTPYWASRIHKLASDGPAPDLAFVVGFPRSGTTLLDTFLMGHPQMHVIDEGKMLERATGVISQAPGVDWPVELVMRAREAYLETLSLNLPTGFKGLVIDKHPMNMLRLPVLHALFPKAKVIFVQRHPCDVVLSGYMQNFELNHAMASFLDLADAADFYDASMTMWTRSRDAFPQEIHSVVYERLTADPAGELRPALEFLGLDWRDELLDHQTTAKSKGTIFTASYDQVVQPLSRAPSGRWRRYRKQLEPVLPILLPWAERLGYED
jgi:tetratricopeptide (TPR) repeat protein